MKKLLLLLLSILFLIIPLNIALAEDIEIKPEIEIDVKINNTEVNISYENQSMLFDCAIAQKTEFIPIIKYNVSVDDCSEHISNETAEVNCLNIPNNISDMSKAFINLSNKLTSEFGEYKDCVIERDTCIANEKLHQGEIDLKDTEINVLERENQRVLPIVLVCAFVLIILLAYVASGGMPWLRRYFKREPKHGQIYDTIKKEIVEDQKKPKKDKPYKEY